MEGVVVNTQAVFPVTEAGVYPDAPAAGDEEARGLVEGIGGGRYHLA